MVLLLSENKKKKKKQDLFLAHVSYEKESKLYLIRLLPVHCCILTDRKTKTKKKKKKKNREYMLQLRNLDLPSYHHYQDRCDITELLERQDEAILYLAPLLREHIFNKYDCK